MAAICKSINSVTMYCKSQRTNVALGWHSSYFCHASVLFVPHNHPVRILTGPAQKVNDLPKQAELLGGGSNSPTRSLSFSSKFFFQHGTLLFSIHLTNSQTTQGDGTRESAQQTRQVICLEEFLTPSLFYSQRELLPRLHGAT
jgi:hypothetical protein